MEVEYTFRKHTKTMHLSLKSSGPFKGQEYVIATVSSRFFFYVETFNLEVI